MARLTNWPSYSLREGSRGSKRVPVASEESLNSLRPSFGECEERRVFKAEHRHYQRAV